MRAPNFRSWLHEESRIALSYYGNFEYFWNKVLDAVFDPIIKSRERKFLARSMTVPVVVGNGRDALRVYDLGRSVTVEALLCTGEVQREFIENEQLRWDKGGARLTHEETGRGMEIVFEDLGKRGIAWRMLSSPSREDRGNNN